MLDIAQQDKAFLELIVNLRNSRLTIATAESCTGGAIGHLFTSLSGSSSWYSGGVIAYSNFLKTQILDVPAIDIESYGAVSEEVARSMALGVRTLSKSNLGISTTGIAGPTGGSDKKPIGTVCFGWAIEDQIYAETQYFSGDRESIRNQAVFFAIKKMNELLLV